MFGSRWFLVPVALIGLVIAGGIAAVAIHHDDDDRGPRVVQVTTPSGDTTSGTTQVIEVRDGWRGHGGFFPGFLLFPLLWIAVIWLVAGAFWRRGGRGGPGGPWGGRFEEWHRQQHAGDSGPTPPAASA
jgi:hypothetical protein